MMKRTIHFIGDVLTFAIANLLFLCGIYDKKIKKSIYFTSASPRYKSMGWKWIMQDFALCKLRGINRHLKWPTSSSVVVVGKAENIEFDYNDLVNFQMNGLYFQAIGKISIGTGAYIAQGVGFITANHSLNNLKEYSDIKSIIIGDNCWIGMNSIILPGVELGKRTIVGAGAVVTKSFAEGDCVIAGNPAKIIKRL